MRLSFLLLLVSRTLSWVNNGPTRSFVGVGWTLSYRDTVEKNRPTEQGQTSSSSRKEREKKYRELAWQIFQKAPPRLHLLMDTWKAQRLGTHTNGRTDGRDGEAKVTPDWRGVLGVCEFKVRIPIPTRCKKVVGNDTGGGELQDGRTNEPTERTSEGAMRALQRRNKAVGFAGEKNGLHICS